MAADLIIISVMQKLQSDPVSDVGSHYHVSTETENLKMEVKKVVKLLDYFSKMQNMDEFGGTGHTLPELLRDIAYDAEDLLDEFEWEALRLKDEERESEEAHFEVKRLKTALKLDIIANRFSGIGNILRGLISTNEDKFLQQPHQHPLEPKVQQVEPLYVFGRDDDKHRISKLLLSKLSDTFAPVIPICGIGGIGKTTLAYLVFNDDGMLQNHFDNKVWVDVSVKFDAGRAIKEILDSVTSKVSDVVEGNDLITSCQSRQQRLLIVLDGVQDLDYTDWDAFSAMLKKELVSAEIRILATTRKPLTASIMGGTIEPYYLGVLSEEYCWRMFNQISSSGPRSSLLGRVGREIVSMCGGIPLAMKTHACLLLSKTDDKWSFPLCTSTQPDDSYALSALKFCSDHLPPHAKRCFTYCSILPKGFIIAKDKLIRLWMAEGFLPCDGMRMEDAGDACFDILLSMSFLQLSGTYYSNHGLMDLSHGLMDSNHGLMVTMHDLVHDLAVFVSSRKEVFRPDENNSGRGPQEARYLSFPRKYFRPVVNQFGSCSKEARYSSSPCKYNGQITFESFYVCKGLRTLLLFATREICIGDLPVDLFLRLSCLRVLDFSHTDLTILPHSICNLKHLRYLDLSHTRIKSLPDSLGLLYNLQTLNLSNLSDLVIRNLWKLINLRHLQLPWNTTYYSRALNIGRLTSLQTLPLFMVGRESGNQIGELKDLSDLRGELQILMLENVLSPEQAREAMLQAKRFLNKLVLRWTSFQAENVEDVLEGLRPPSSLMELEIRCYGGSRFPSWMLNPRCLNLVSITLHCCINCTFLPPLGQLQHLKYLHIYIMDQVKYIDHKFSKGYEDKGFPALKRLVLNKMTNLEEWRGVVEGDMPNLHELSIADCSKLRELPSLTIFTNLRKLEISGCPQLSPLPEEGLPTMIRSQKKLSQANGALLKGKGRGLE